MQKRGKSRFLFESYKKVLLNTPPITRTIVYNYAREHLKCYRRAKSLGKLRRLTTKATTACATLAVAKPRATSPLHPSPLPRQPFLQKTVHFQAWQGAYGGHGVISVGDFIISLLCVVLKGSTATMYVLHHVS